MTDHMFWLVFYFLFLLSFFLTSFCHNADRLRELLDVFIDKFVLCKSCKNPETELRVIILKVNRTEDIIQESRTARSVAKGLELTCQCVTSSVVGLLRIKTKMRQLVCYATNRNDTSKWQARVIRAGEIIKHKFTQNKTTGKYLPKCWIFFLPCWSHFRVSICAYIHYNIPLVLLLIPPLRWTIILLALWLALQIYSSALFRRSYSGVD
jgi:hypothetical protein